MKSVRTFYADIYVGLREGYDGPLHSVDEVHDLCQRFVNDISLGVTVTPTRFVYKGGQESGVIVGLINYPRFPSDRTAIVTHALMLATTLKAALGQQRVSIVMPDETIMLGDE